MPQGRRGRRRKSSMGYFNQLFEQHPAWLQETSNEVILNQYRLDHGLSEGAPIREKIKANLANTKSVMRRKKGRPGCKAKVKASVVGLTSPKRLEALEIQIDDCILLASNIDREA